MKRRVERDPEHNSANHQKSKFKLQFMACDKKLYKKYFSQRLCQTYSLESVFLGLFPQLKSNTSAKFATQQFGDLSQHFRNL